MTAIGNIFNTSSVSPPPVTQLMPAAPAGSTGGFSFGDILDAVNPLQHIPVISGLYRAATGSQISATSQVAGDTLYGAAFGGVSALLGFVSSVANVAVKQATGEDISQHVVATVNAAANTVTAPSGTANTAAVTPLVANSGTTAPPASVVAGDTSKFSAQLANATQAIYHTNAHQNYQHTNAQYQRAQAFDAINKSLVKMAI